MSSCKWEEVHQNASNTIWQPPRPAGEIIALPTVTSESRRLCCRIAKLNCSITATWTDRSNTGIKQTEYKMWESAGRPKQDTWFFLISVFWVHENSLLLWNQWLGDIKGIRTKKAGYNYPKKVDWVKVLHPTRHKIGHFRDALPSQSLD